MAPRSITFLCRVCTASHLNLIRLLRLLAFLSQFLLLLQHVLVHEGDILLLLLQAACSGKVDHDLIFRLCVSKWATCARMRSLERKNKKKVE